MKAARKAYVLLCILWRAFPLAAASENLLQDGGFENMPSAWQVREGATICAGKARTGVNAILLPGPGRSNAFCTVSGLTQGKFYRVDAWARTRGMRANPNGYAAIYMDGVGCFSTNLNDHHWECVTAWFEARDAKPFRIYLIREGIPTGDIYFDDVSLRECENPNVKPVTFEDGSTLGLMFSRSPNSVARVVEGLTPDGKRYLSASTISCCYVMPQPIAKGDVKFHFLLKPAREGSVSLQIGMRLDFTPSVRVPDGSNRTVALGILTPDCWYRVQGVIHLDKQTYDLKMTDYVDPLGSMERKGLLIPGEVRKVTNMWLNISQTETGLDDMFVGPTE